MRQLRIDVMLGLIISTMMACATAPKTPSEQRSLEQRADVRMAESGDRLRLPFEAAAPCRVTGELSGQDLERDVSLQAGVSRAVDHTHAPAADGCEDLVRTNMRACCDRHDRSGGDYRSMRD